MPLGATWMLASTQVLVAGPELCGTPLVERVTKTLPSETVPVALAVMFCTVELFTVTEQVAVLLTATRLGPQVLLVTVTPPGIDGVIPKPLAVWLPGRAFRVMVKVCEWLTSFTPLG